MPLFVRPRIARPIFAAALLLLAVTGTVRSQPFSWASQSLGTDIILNAITYSPERGERLAVGSQGAVVTSKDAVTWIRGSAGTTTTLLNGVAWGSGLYVAVGMGGLIRTSPDGVTWTTRGAGTTNELTAVAWIGPSTNGAGQWIAVGRNGTIRTSPDGITWTSRTSGMENTNPTTGLRAIAWANPFNTPTGMAITVGDNGRILTSTDGITWTPRNPGNGLAGSAISFGGVVWNGTQALIVGKSGVIITSSNLTSWTSRSLLNSNYALSSAVWVPGAGSGRYVAGGTGYPALIHSTDGGVTWADVPGTFNSHVMVQGTWDGSHVIALSSNGKLFISHDGVLPGTPTLHAPADNAADVSLRPTLSWTPVSGAGTYDIMVSTQASFSSGVVINESVTDTVYPVPASFSLPENTDVYWRVRARTVAGSGGWSTSRKFRTLQNPPSQVTLSAPANKATARPAYVEFIWSPLSGITGCTLQLALDSTFTSVERNESLPASNSARQGPLSFGKTYYWRVRAYNEAGTGPWSAVRSFTTEAAPTGVPPAPLLVTPVLFAAQVSVSPAFSWNNSAGAVSYHLQVSGTASFTTKTAEDSLLTQTSFAAAALKGSTEYFWRVRARNGFGFGPWSEPWAFTTVVAKPEAPVQTSPANLATNVSAPATLTWSSVPGAMFYHVQVSLNPEFSTFVARDSTVTATTRSAGNLMSTTHYYWRVRAKNSAGVSDWSSIRRFTTGAIVLAVGPGADPSRALSVRADGVDFHLRESGRVVIRLFDARGGNATELVNGFLEAGPHKVRIPASARGNLRILLFQAAGQSRTLTLAP